MKSRVEEINWNKSGEEMNTVNKIKNIKLNKGMSKDEVNELTKEYILLEDEEYLGWDYRHNWKCKCGNTIECRTWNNIRGESSIKCNLCKYNDIERRYKYEVEKDNRYRYIRSYRCGEILPTGKTAKSVYLHYECLYCNYTSIVTAGSFLNQNKRCNKCCRSYENSIAYYVEQELNKPLDKYWDFEKNTVNPYHISKSSIRYIWIKCQNEEVNEKNGLMKKDYHGSYEIRCDSFLRGHRCGYCNGKKTHPLDSFGYIYPEEAKYWHKDNKSPYEVMPKSVKKYKFKCDACNHIWRVRMDSFITYKKCPQCAGSKGEVSIGKWLTINNIEYIYNKPYFNDLLSDLGNPLKPDFILPNRKIWIEYDGEQHYKWIEGWVTKEEFKTLKNHDNRKNEYAKSNGWKLIRIPYWDFDNIEHILEKEILKETM